MPVRSILIFPGLFTAGMCLVDTADGILMLGAYGWAYVHPARKLYYIMTITAVSAIGYRRLGYQQLEFADSAFRSCLLRRTTNQWEVFRPDGPIISFMLQTHAPTPRLWHWWDTLFAVAILVALLVLILLLLG